MQEIIDLLYSQYLFLHPEMPSWSTSTNKKGSMSKAPDPAKDPKNVTLQASSTLGSTSNAPTANKLNISMGIQCYNCKGFGHLSWDCPTPKQKLNGGGGHGGADVNNGGNTANVEGTPKPGNTTTPSVVQNSNPKLNMQSQYLKPVGQAGMVENINFAYMAELSSDISEDNWSDNEYEEEILVPLLPQFLNRLVSQITGITDEEIGPLTTDELDHIKSTIKDLGNQLSDEKRKLLSQVNATLIAQHASQWLYEKFTYEVWEDEEDKENDSESDDEDDIRMESDDEGESENVPDAQGGNNIYMCVTDPTFILDDGINIDESSKPVVMQTDSMEPTASVFTFTVLSQGAAEIRTGEGTIPVRNVLYVPELANTLVSIGELDDAGYTVTFGGGQAVICGPDGKVCGSIPKSNGLYQVIGDTSNWESYTVVERLMLDEFHRCMGHILGNLLVAQVFLGSQKGWFKKRLNILYSDKIQGITKPTIHCLAHLGDLKTFFENCTRNSLAYTLFDHIPSVAR
ncbi:hypothetical protein D9758_009480 [Tetrapyrgos nigripes]|uniref:CCHC-type domain-containing protein n=1 Tax=Tetrapyrgos nigripes TaxID=182062 RepID=A0A8H5LE97_9AGAR|nr:hypothetical protein D9758_009480 [Tetrapyrgos nigripes]